MRIARVVTSQSSDPVLVAGQTGQLVRLTGDPLSGRARATTETVVAARWLPPVDVSAIICIGLNYRQHAAESNLPVPTEPVVFMKNPAAATGHLQPIRLPRVCADEVDYECELGVVIGRDCRDVPAAQALDVVAGYLPANDVSARVWQMQRGGSQWVRGKSFDTFAPVGPFLVTRDEVPNPNALAIRTRLNGELLQDSNTADMIFDVATVISFLTQDTTLRAGTLILTGTPQGIGWARQPKRLLQAGDDVRIEIDGLGVLINPVTQ